MSDQKFRMVVMSEEMKPSVTAKDTNDETIVEVINTGKSYPAGAVVMLEWHESERDIPEGYRIVGP